MNKKLLPAMIGAALAAGMATASADVTIFGHIDTSFDGFDEDGGSDDLVLNCTTCSIGFKGSEDLGNGLKAIFSLDFQYDTTERNAGSRTTVSTSTKQFTTKSGASTKHVTSVSTSSSGGEAIIDRDQWLGLAGGFGKVRIGTISTGYKSHGAMIDPLYRTALQGRDHGLQSNFHSGAGEELQGRATNTVRWDSANFSGVKLVAHYTLDSDESDGEDEDPFGIGASYENGGLLVFADYLNNNGDGVSEAEGWKVGGRYDMGMFSVMAQYEDYDDSTSDQDDEDLWHVGGMVNNLLGMDIYLGFAQGEDDNDDDDYTAWTLALMHDMSKNTMVYIGHTQVDCDGGGFSGKPCDFGDDDGGERDQTSVGIKHKF